MRHYTTLQTCNVWQTEWPYKSVFYIVGHVYYSFDKHASYKEIRAIRIRRVLMVNPKTSWHLISFCKSCSGEVILTLVLLSTWSIRFFVSLSLCLRKFFLLFLLAVTSYQSLFWILSNWQKNWKENLSWLECSVEKRWTLR